MKSEPTRLSAAIKPIVDEVRQTLHQFPSQFDLSQMEPATVTIRFSDAIDGAIQASLDSVTFRMVRADRMNYDREVLEGPFK